MPEAAVWRVSAKYMVLNFAKFAYKQPCFSLKLYQRPATLLKEVLAQVFTVNFANFLRKPFL